MSAFAGNIMESLFHTVFMYHFAMPKTQQVGRSITLPSHVDKQIEAIAQKRRLSGNRVLVELVETGPEARRQKEEAFFDLARRFRESDDPEEAKKLGSKLGRMIFGE
jgi:hypothetical protein